MSLGANGSTSLHLHGVGHFHPEREIDNRFLESLDIGTSDSWIVERVGIRSRRTVLDLEYIRQTRNADPRASHEASSHTNAETGALAGRKALARAGVRCDEVGLVIAGGCAPEHTTPAEACVIAAELGIESPCFDLSSACTSFGAQLAMLRSMGSAVPFVSSSKPFVLLVQPENMTRAVDYRERRVAVLWGDASTAAVVSWREPSRARVLEASLRSKPSAWQKVRIPTGGFFEQDGHAVQAFAIRTTSELVAELRRYAPHPWFIGHQANLLVLQGVCRRMEIPAERHLYNVDAFGNCGAAGAPSVLSQHWESFEPGDEVGLALVGAGLSGSGVLIAFGAR